MSAAAETKLTSSSTVAYAIGAILIALSLIMLIPLLLNTHEGQHSTGAFLSSSFFCLFSGGLLYFTNRQGQHHLSVRSGFALTILSWLAVGFFSALPYVFGAWQLSLTDALFESFSGLTTTGSTVIIGLDNSPRDLLLWRSMTQALGGIGIIMLAMTLLPYLRVGGMQLFHAESSDRHEKILPRMADLGKALIGMYILLTGFCFMGYATAGMNAFDALNHALTTISTGGFSTHDTSFAYFDSARIDWIASFFMFSGALPFILYIRFMIKRDFAFWQDDQVRFFTYIIVGAVATIALYLVHHQQFDSISALRYAAFNVISILSTTGFANADYIQWGMFPVVTIFFLTYLGGCSGSTSGGLKTMRIVILTRTLLRELYKMISPNRVYRVTFNHHPVEEKVLIDVLGFLCFYVMLNVGLTLALHLCGLDFETALSGAATAISNTGPGVGGTIGPAGNFAGLPDTAKWLLTAGMIIGRLEILTFLAVLTPAFWRR